MAETKSERSWEFVAIPTVAVMFGILGLIMWAATAGLWIWLAVGVVALAGLVVFVLRTMRRPHHPTEQLHVARLDDGVNRVLVIADDSCWPADLEAAFADRRDRPIAVLVLAPVLGSRTARWTGDEHAYQAATEHLDATLAALADLGIEARGRIASHDPLQAADDGLRSFPADEIVFAVHPAIAANWLEEGVVAAARERYAIPVRQLDLVTAEGC